MRYSDVPADHWASQYIEELTSKGVINGYPDGSYGPNGTLTKGQFIKLIVSASLPDIDYEMVEGDFDHWASKYLRIAENYGAVEEGSITLENIDQPISRIDVVKIMGLCDIEMRKHIQKSVKTLSFYDVAGLSITEKVMLRHAVANEIIGGYPDGSFKPNNNLTRAEVAKILSIYMKIEE